MNRTLRIVLIVAGVAIAIAVLVVVIVLIVNAARKKNRRETILVRWDLQTFNQNPKTIKNILSNLSKTIHQSANLATKDELEHYIRVGGMFTRDYKVALQGPSGKWSVAYVDPGKKGVVYEDVTNNVDKFASSNIIALFDERASVTSHMGTDSSHILPFNLSKKSEFD